MMTKTPKTVSLNAISKDFTKQDWQEVENEKKYYHLVLNLRKMRKKEGLTQKELAAKANLPRETVVKIESGKRNTTLDTLMSLAKAMGKNLIVDFR